MLLLDFTSEVTEKEVEYKYKLLCKKGPYDIFEDGEFPDEDEDELSDLTAGNLSQGPADPAFDLLGALQRETVFVDPEEDDAEEPSVENRSGVEDPDLDQFADREDMKILLEDVGEDSSKPPVSKDPLPSTLLGAMKETGCTWNALWRLVVKLRSAAGGSDLRWVPNAKNVRRCSPNLNWRQRLA